MPSLPPIFLLVFIVACAPSRRASCEPDEVCVSDAIVSACFEDLASRDGELRELRALASKGLRCIAESEHHSYLLRVTDRPDCARCVEQQTCFAIGCDHACRPDCLREPDGG